MYVCNHRAMTGQRSVPERRRPRPCFFSAFVFWLLALLTLFAPSLPSANVAGVAPVTVRPAGPTNAQSADHPAPQSETTLRRQHRVLSAAPVPNRVDRGSAEDNADECPGDVEKIQHESSMPSLFARAAPRDAIEVAPSAIRMTDKGWAGDESAPSSAYRCNPDGRGPPARG